jgi:hypothetical protein
VQIDPVGQLDPEEQVEVVIFGYNAAGAAKPFN